MRLRKCSVEIKYFLLSINLLLSKLLSLIFIPHCRQIIINYDKRQTQRKVFQKEEGGSRTD